MIHTKNRVLNQNKIKISPLMFRSTMRIITTHQLGSGCLGLTSTLIQLGRCWRRRIGLTSGNYHIILNMNCIRKVLGTLHFPTSLVRMLGISFLRWSSNQTLPMTWLFCLNLRGFLKLGHVSSPMPSIWVEVVCTLSGGWLSNIQWYE